ncbi:MAG TPA: hypothetical protein VKO45_01385, partial [Methanomicrobiales archaeon]|nr:hypothetical protein [Methanomicrobiales archaeon]
MATVSETGNSGMAIAAAIVAGVVVYFLTLEASWAAVAAIVIGYLVMGIRIVRPTHRVLIEFLGKYQKYGNPGL